MIQIKNLTKIYNLNKPNQFIALKDINLDIKTNETVILKGVSGSGKSTLLAIIAGLLKPTNGYVKIDNELIYQMAQHHLAKFRLNHIGYIHQSFNLINHFSVFENILASLALTNLTILKATQKIDYFLKQFNLYNKKDELIYNLSGGEKQRVAIIRALINDANILICDEPSANLDKTNTLSFISILKKLKNKTIIIATHDDIFDDLGRIVLIKDGVIIE